MLIVSIITVTLAIQNIRNAEEKERAAVRAKNEQLRADLLRTISHDLRTPLTSISGNASNLISTMRRWTTRPQANVSGHLRRLYVAHQSGGEHSFHLPH